jgi:hypothetical protein
MSRGKCIVGRRFAALAVLLALVGAGVAGPARADPGNRGVEAAGIVAGLVGRFGLTEEETGALRPQVEVHLDRGGDAKGVEALAKGAAKAGCEGGCLIDALAAVNRSMWLGQDPDDARTTVLRVLKESAREGGPGTLAERMQARMERLHRQNPGGL